MNLPSASVAAPAGAWGRWLAKRGPDQSLLPSAIHLQTKEVLVVMWASFRIPH